MPKLEDQLKSEEQQAGRGFKRRETRALLVLLLVLLLVTLGVVLCQAATELSSNTVQILTQF